LPKIVIKTFGRLGEEVCDLEQAEGLLDFEGRIVTVDGKTVPSYNDLVRLANQDKYRDKGFIEVVLLPTLMGG
jgi:hypothetical protein